MNRQTSRLALAALFVIAAVGATTSCGSSGGGSDPVGAVAPSNLVYPTAQGFYRVGEAIAANVPTVDGDTPMYSVAPPLPAGLNLDPATGAISGTPTGENPTSDFTVTASNSAGTTDFVIPIGIGPQLPAGIAFLADGFICEEVATGLNSVSKIALADDGRIFFNELGTGDIRVIGAGGTLIPTPYASVSANHTLLTGGHRGLLGLARRPGFIYVVACVGAITTPTVQADRMVVIRYADSMSIPDVGDTPTIMLDNLPIAPAPGLLNNGGDLAFDLNGLLFLSIGDTGMAVNAQAPTGTSLAGKVLRYDVSTVPATPAVGNPTVGDPEWVNGLRNTFCLAVHPTTGDLYGGDNEGTEGAFTTEDILGYFAAGKNFGWGTLTPPAGGIAGHAMWTSPDITVPTGLIWHTGNIWGTDYADDIFMTAYDDNSIIRFETSTSQGSPALVNVDADSVFAETAQIAGGKPIDIEHNATTGALVFATFTSIYRITKQQ